MTSWIAAIDFSASSMRIFFSADERELWDDADVGVFSHRDDVEEGGENVLKGVRIDDDGEAAGGMGIFGNVVGLNRCTTGFGAGDAEVLALEHGAGSFAPGSDIARACEIHERFLTRTASR